MNDIYYVFESGEHGYCECGAEFYSWFNIDDSEKIRRLFLYSNIFMYMQRIKESKGL